MSLLEEMSVTLAEGSTISFGQSDGIWEVNALAPSDKLIEALGPHIMETKELVLNCFSILVHDAPSLPEPQSFEEEARLSQLAIQHLIYPFLRLESMDAMREILEVGTPVRLVYSVEDGGGADSDEDFELLVSTVAFSIQI